MSWFRHSPPKHPPLAKNHQAPHRTSPAAERAMEEAKQTGVSKPPSKKK